MTDLPPELRRFYEELPPIVPRDVTSLKGAYGADLAAAAYCGFQTPPKTQPGIWQHGWISKQRAIDPATVIGGYGSYEQVKATERFWVARLDQEQYLREHGYRHVKAIGLPLIYQPEKHYERMPQSLLVLPVHSLTETSHQWDCEEYADAIAQIRGRFATVVICIHPTCWTKGYRVDAFRKRGFPLVQGVNGGDQNAQLRLQQLFRSFEYVTTNGYGSHLVYANYHGAKVSIYGPYAVYKAEDYVNTPLYRNCPHILEPMLQLTSEKRVREDYPFLFCDPDKAVASVDWAAHEVGLDCRVSPGELRKLFQWTPYHLARHRVGVMVYRARQQPKNTPPVFTGVFVARRATSFAIPRGQLTGSF